MESITQLLSGFDLNTHCYMIVVPAALTVYLTFRLTSNNFTTCPYIINGFGQTADQKALSTTKPGGTQDSSEAVGAPLKHFTAEELLQYDGTDANGAVYVAIKGVVFDVTDNRKAYEPGQGYAIFAGRDASRALGLMSLKKKDAVPNLDGLEEKQIDVLDNWVKFYQKKYMIMGTVGPNASPGRLPAIATAETKPSE